MLFIYLRLFAYVVCLMALCCYVLVAGCDLIVCLRLLIVLILHFFVVWFAARWLGYVHV